MSEAAPDEGDVVWVQFDPLVGHEQAGHRPAIVLTPAAYNPKSGLLLCVPMTTRVKGYPFEVPIPGDPPAVALVDHVKSLDWRGRKEKPKTRVSEAELEQVRWRLRGLIG